MNKSMQASRISRRGFLQGAAGSALALATGNLLGGCGGGGESFAPRNNKDRFLFVSTFLHDTVERFNSETGAHETSYMTGNNPAKLPPGSGAAGIAVGYNNDLWVANRFQDSVDRIDIGTGDKLMTLENLHACHSLAIGTDGILYVPNVPSFYNGMGFVFGDDTIERFDAHTGDYLGTFAHMPMPFSLVWGPDNNLYASSALELANTHPNSDGIRRFDPKTGSFAGFVVQGDKVPFDYVFTNRGTILVCEFLENRVQEYSIATGASVRTFANVTFPIGIAVGPGGDVFVGENTDPLGPLGSNVGTVLRFDGTTGASKGAFLSNLSYAAFLYFYNVA